MLAGDATGKTLQMVVGAVVRQAAPEASSVAVVLVSGVTEDGLEEDAGEQVAEEEPCGGEVDHHGVGERLHIGTKRLG